MLALTRKAGESIRIGTDIDVHVVAIRGNRVHLAIDAPREIPIKRNEHLDETAATPQPKPEPSHAD